MILAVEIHYRDGEHASVNASLLESLSLACGPTVFAAMLPHQARVQEAAAPTARAVTSHDISVITPGGVQFRRIWAQWKTLMDLMDYYAPHKLVLLSTGPETLFVARALVARFRALQVFAIMHGNLSDITGWRSRDPRRRLIDFRSGLRVARHPRIRLVMLEEHIRDAAMRQGLRNEMLVWPHPIPAHEIGPVAPWTPGPRLRLAFVGTAHKGKGFNDFLAVHSAAGPLYDWSLIGRLSPAYAPEQVAGIGRPSGFLARAEFVQQVRQADYAVAAFPSHYEFTASGSLLDCVAQCKPLIAVDTPVLAGLARRYGPIGYLCPDISAVRRLLMSPGRLSDRGAYASFQSSLDAMRRDRMPDVLARQVCHDLQCPAPSQPGR